MAETADTPGKGSSGTATSSSGTMGTTKTATATSETVLKRYGVSIRDLSSVTKTDYSPSPSMQHLKRQFFKEQSVSMSDGSLKFLPTDLVFAMHAVARSMHSYNYGHMRALMLWMTYLAGLENRRNEEYIQNLQNRLETGNRQLFKRNKYFFLPQNREVRRNKFAGSFEPTVGVEDDDIIVDEVIRATSGTNMRSRGRGRARGRGGPSRGYPASGGAGRLALSPSGTTPSTRGYPSSFGERRGGPERRGGLSSSPSSAPTNERSPDLRGLRVLQSRNPPTSGPSFFGRLGGGAPLGLAAQQGNFKQPEISLMLDCEDDPLTPAQLEKYRKDVENYKATLKAQKYLNANGPRTYSTDYSNDTAGPEDDDEQPPPPPPPPPEKQSQLALPAPPRGMRPGPRTAKLAEQLGQQGTEETTKRNLQYVVQNGKLVLVQGQTVPQVQLQLKSKGPPGKPASAQARSHPEKKGQKRGIDEDYEPKDLQTGKGSEGPVRISSRTRVATKTFDISEIENQNVAKQRQQSSEARKAKEAKDSKEKAKSSSVPTKETKQAAIRAAANQGAILAAKTAVPKYVKPAGKGNWLPIHEYFYGRREGEPSYTEQKGGFRFKCWHCEKMLYNNLKAVNHVIGHIDINKQKSVELGDLTSCKQCFEHFDSPFEMQCHAEKQHFSNQRLLMCRICDKNLQTEDALKVHMTTVHVACDMPYKCTLCKYRSSLYTDLLDHFKKRHSGSSNVICLYCTRIFTLQKVGTNEDSAYCRTQNYYIHLQKHQVQSMQKRCNTCLLTFLTAQDLKSHRQYAHQPNKVAAKISTFGKGDKTLVFVKEKVSRYPFNETNVDTDESKEDTDKDYAGMTLRLRQDTSCVECKSSMNHIAHYKKHVECALCPFATSCSQSYSDHMISFHSGDFEKKGKVIPKDRPIANFEDVIDFGDDDEDDFETALGGIPKEKPKTEPPRLPPVPWWCICGFSTMFGNDLCDHLIKCSRRTAYAEKPETRYVEIDADVEDSDDDEDGNGQQKTSSNKTIFDALGLQPKMTEEDDSDNDHYEQGDLEKHQLEAQRALNKVLDKVCGRKSVEEEEDIATILRKPIDFTKSDKLEEPLEQESDGDDDEEEELAVEMDAVLRALKNQDDQSDNESDKSSSWADDEEDKEVDVANLNEFEGTDETKRTKDDDDDQMDADPDEADEEEGLDDEEKEEKGLRTGGKRRMKKRVQRKIDSDSDDDDDDDDSDEEGEIKKRKKARVEEDEAREEGKSENGGGGDEDGENKDADEKLEEDDKRDGDVGEKVEAPEANAEDIEMNSECAAATESENTADQDVEQAVSEAT